MNPLSVALALPHCAFMCCLILVKLLCRALIGRRTQSMPPPDFSANIMRPDYPSTEEFDNDPQIKPHFVRTPGLTPIPVSSKNHDINLVLRPQVSQLYHKHGIQRCPNYGLFYADHRRYTMLEDRDKMVLLVVELKEGELEKWRLIDSDLRKLREKYYTNDEGYFTGGVTIRYYKFWSGWAAQERIQRQIARQQIRTSFPEPGTVRPPLSTPATQATLTLGAAAPANSPHIHTHIGAVALASSVHIHAHLQGGPVHAPAFDDGNFADDEDDDEVPNYGDLPELIPQGGPVLAPAFEDSNLADDENEDDVPNYDDLPDLIPQDHEDDEDEADEPEEPPHSLPPFMADLPAAYRRGAVIENDMVTLPATDLAIPVSGPSSSVMNDLQDLRDPDSPRLTFEPSPPSSSATPARAHAHNETLPRPTLTRSLSAHTRVYHEETQRRLQLMPAPSTSVLHRVQHYHGPSPTRSNSARFRAHDEAQQRLQLEPAPLSSVFHNVQHHDNLPRSEPLPPLSPDTDAQDDARSTETQHSETGAQAEVPSTNGSRTQPKREQPIPAWEFR